MQCVWYRLVYAEGTTFQGSPTDKISVPTTLDIADFRRVIKRENANKLRDVDASDLVIFSSKAIKELPLKSNCKLQGLGETEEEALDVVVPSNSAAGNSLWLVTASIVTLVSSDELTSLVFRLSDELLGYYDKNHPPIRFDQDITFIHVLFEQKERALQFESRLRIESQRFKSMSNSVQVASNVTPVQGQSAEHRIYYGDYCPDEQESDDEDMSNVSRDYSLCEQTSDLFRYQRLERVTCFGPYARAESTRLMTKENCRVLDTFKIFENDESNRLALSSDMQSWFDGHRASIPYFKLTVYSESEIPVLNNRYKIVLNLQVFDSACAETLFSRLHESAIPIDQLNVQIAVYILNPQIFKTCIEWRSRQTEQAWDDFRNMTPAVP